MHEGEETKIGCQDVGMSLGRSASLTSRSRAAAKADRKILMRASTGDVSETARAPVESCSSEGREEVSIFKDSANALKFASSAANASNVVAGFSGIGTLFF
jgi:hypothetical protein